MHRIVTALAALMLVSTLAGVASAHPYSPRIDRREARQHARIRAGWHQGDLTRAEARRLRVGQRHVHRMERRFKADGHLSMRERARIQRVQNHQSRRIWRMRHNGRQA